MKNEIRPQDFVGKVEELVRASANALADCDGVVRRERVEQELASLPSRTAYGADNVYEVVKHFDKGLSIDDVVRDAVDGAQRAYVHQDRDGLHQRLYRPITRDTVKRLPVHLREDALLALGAKPSTPKFIARAFTGEERKAWQGSLAGAGYAHLRTKRVDEKLLREIWDKIHHESSNVFYGPWEMRTLEETTLAAAKKKFITPKSDWAPGTKAAFDVIEDFARAVGTDKTKIYVADLMTGGSPTRAVFAIGRGKVVMMERFLPHPPRPQVDLPDYLTVPR